MNFESFSDIEKNLYVNFLINHQDELFNSMVVLIEERIKSIVPNMIQEYLNQNPQKVVIDTSQAENQLSNLFKNLKL